MTEQLARKLQIKDDSRVWLSSGEVLTGPVVEALLQSIATVQDTDMADVALIGVKDSAAADALLNGEIASLAHARAVWLIYPKGNRTDINRDILWQQLLGVGWKAVSQVAVDDVVSALRVRLLKPGDAV